jgi:hypothetical protein
MRRGGDVGFADEESVGGICTVIKSSPGHRPAVDAMRREFEIPCILDSD